jgi:hypothetical protein
MSSPDLSAASPPHDPQATRPPRALGPSPDAESLRASYLELLKLALCDLAGPGTVSVGKWEGGRVSSRELDRDTLWVRAAGMDWPLHGTTMVGLQRLDDLQGCVESVMRDGVAGDLIEAGAWRGGASILMRATLDALGADDRTVWVADSFQGFPLADDQGDLNLVDFIAVPLEEVQANFARFGLDHGVRFVPGFFEESMPGLSGGRWSVVRLDGDTYEATWTTLSALYPGLAVGGHLIVDDYGAVPECARAVDEFRERHGIAEPLERVDWTCVRWRREDDTPIEPAPPMQARHQADPSQRLQPMERAGSGVPTERELELARERDDLRRRLAVAEAEIERLARSPVAGPGAWLRRLAVERRRRA